MFWKLTTDHGNPNESRPYERIAYFALPGKAPFSAAGVADCGTKTSGSLLPLTGGGALVMCLDEAWELPPTYLLMAPDGTVTRLQGHAVAAAPDGSNFAVLDKAGTSVSIRDPHGTELRRLIVPASRRVEWLGATLALKVIGEAGEGRRVYLDPETGAVLTTPKPEVIAGVTWTQQDKDGQHCLLADGQAVRCITPREADSEPWTLVPSPDASHIAVVWGDGVHAAITPATRTVFEFPSGTLFVGWESESTLIMEEPTGTQMLDDGTDEFIREPILVRVVVDEQRAELVPDEVYFFPHWD